MGIGASIFMIAVGAIIAFALDVRVGWLDLDVVGWVLMLAGVFGLLLTFGMFSSSRRRAVARTSESTVYGQDRRVVETPAQRTVVVDPLVEPTVVETPSERRVTSYEEVERPL
jgi:hypothetical protein